MAVTSSPTWLKPKARNKNTAVWRPPPRHPDSLSCFPEWSSAAGSEATSPPTLDREIPSSRNPEPGEFQQAPCLQRRNLHIHALLDMFLCMRTTIEINDELFQQAKNRAAVDGTPLRAVVESALRTYLVQHLWPSGYRLHWRTESGQILPGVNLDDRDSLFDVMEGRR